MNNNVKSLYHLERILCILIIVCFFVPWINIIGVGLSGFYLANNVINEEIGPIYVLYAIPILSIVSGCFNKKKLYLVFPILGIICIYMNTPYGENINYGSGLILTIMLQIFSVLFAISMPKEIIGENKQRAEIVKLVSKNDKENENALIDAVAEECIEEVKKLLTEGVDVNVKRGGGMTPLHLAASNGQETMVALLQSEGAVVNSKDVDGQTPLDWAVDKGHKEIADLLRKHGGKTRKELKAEGK